MRKYRKENGFMYIDWEMSIGYPGATQEGTAEIELTEIEDKSDLEQNEIISQAIWEDAMQYVDVYPKKTQGE
ncbi:hypothetical protein H6F38_13975 [Paenibacillus sp. EKM208P]|nr:hypothetical protein H6F38_13975 [Paenibacillus sp. EKM208P]